MRASPQGAEVSHSTAGVNVSKLNFVKITALHAMSGTEKKERMVEKRFSVPGNSVKCKYTSKLF